MNLLFIIYFQLATQFILYEINTQKKVGSLAITESTVYLKMDIEGIEEFTLKNKVRRGGETLYFVQSNKAKGVIVRGHRYIQIHLIVYEKYFYDKNYLTSIRK